jgi:hypothetical protein
MRRVFVAPLVILVLVGILFTSARAHAVCGLDVIIIKGRVEHSARNSSVCVRLMYPKQQPGESGEITVEQGQFAIQIPFLTRSRAPVLMGSLLEKCDRKPKTMVVTLLQGDQNQEYDRVSLDLTKDFKMADPSAYTLRTEIVLNGPH